MSDPRLSLFPRIGDRVHIRDLHGATLRTSKNLRGILEFARKSPVNVVAIRDLGNGLTGVAFYFDGGAHAFTTWSDLNVVLCWLANRRSWSIERVTFGEELRNKIRPLGSQAWHNFIAWEIAQSGTLVTFHRYQD